MPSLKSTLLLSALQSVMVMRGSLLSDFDFLVPETATSLDSLEARTEPGLRNLTASSPGPIFSLSRKSVSLMFYLDFDSKTISSRQLGPKRGFKYI